MSLLFRERIHTRPLPRNLHSWTDPGHYLSCESCNIYRAIETRKAERQAHTDASILERSESILYRSRNIIVSPRLIDRQLPSFYQEEQQYRYTSIRVPYFRGSNTTQALGLSGAASASGQLRPASTRKRPVTCTSTPEPAQYYVPGQFPGYINHTQVSPQAETDFWTLNADLIRQEALETSQAATSASFNEKLLSMPGAWPSWADELDDVPATTIASTPRRQQAQDGSPGFLSTHARGIFSFFGNLSSFVLGASRNAPWRLVPPDQTAQEPQHPDPPHAVATTSVTAAVTPTAENVISRSPKRLRSDPGPLRATPPSSGPQSSLATSNQLNPDFNYAGHFSLDALYASDSEDEEEDYAGSPMLIDSPEHLVSQRTETKPAPELQPGHPRSILKSEHRKPIALNSKEAILAGNQSSPSVAAARRAVRRFPKELPIRRPSGSANLGRRPIESLRRGDKEPTTFDHAGMVQSPESTIYDDVLEFFPNDVSHSLPGLGAEDLPADADKVEHLKREFRERVRLEEIASQNAALLRLGVRRPKSTLIREPSAEWKGRALDAPRNGHFNPTTVHPDAVELKPRDFAKLVPPTAWLNDDCVHSTLCCLAAYINDKAGVKPKVDPPKCVAVSSLYWTAFSGDHKKLYPRLFSRKWGMNPDNFFNIDTVLIPVNLQAHWTLIVIRPSLRTVSYIDSFHSRNPLQVRYAYEWLSLFLGPIFVESEWHTTYFDSPQQTNAYDCGVFVITNSICLALGIDPKCYEEKDLPTQRLRLASVLLNGGFRGEFSLSDL
ncbi:hypothetical protein F5B22DRAFT_644822 [Xylaria bambusicola]|uniref:uncharacterized protein n=1 Tax=Xylaria bambusicola TaxID=326684 RepID=UPI0020072805|nr:uncharacterized protein F5B22DRAFT_644822 [Xylaria bambusicola]KAI0518517.1 hypothetical protein F5B22DRAFT_644822 [Xylaria bambusicola]